MTRFIVAALVLGAVYLVLLLVHPVHRCPSCKGRRSVAHGKSRRPCKRCKTTGRTYRPGSIMAHRLVRDHAFPWIRDRIRDRIAARTGDDR